MADIKIYGKLVNKTDGKIADAEQIAYDSNQNIKDVLATTVRDVTEISSQLNDYATKEELSSYAKVEDIPSGENGIIINEVETLDLDSVELETATYVTKNAINTPFGTKGKLSVIKTENEWYEEWSTAGAVATRTACLTSTGVNSITVNGETPEIVNNTIRLAACGEYELSGFFYGHIIIDIPSSGVIGSATNITFNNVFIKSDTEKAIEYLPESKSLKIYLAKNSKNYISAITENTVSEVSNNATIFSESNLAFEGAGYISIQNNYGSHAIKASELEFRGRGHYYITTNGGHDGIHAGKYLFIENGIFEIANCKDAIGCGINKNNIGLVRIFAGNFNLHNNLQSGFDFKDLFASGASASNTAYIYESNFLNITESENGTEDLGVTYVNSSNAQSIYGNYSISGDAVSTNQDGDYVLTGTSYTISGYINKNIIVNTKSTDIILNNAYIDGNILYSPSSGKLKIKCDDNAPFNDSKSGKGNSNNYVDVVTGTIRYNNNITINGDAVFLGNSITHIGAASTKGKAIFYGDGPKFLNSLTCKKFYLGADDDNYDAGTVDSNASQEIYFNNVVATNVRDSVMKDGAIDANSIYEYQTGDMFIKTVQEVFKKNLSIAAEVFNYEDLALDTEFDESVYAPANLTGEWTVIKESPELEQYATRDSVDAAFADLQLTRKYNDMAAAETDIASGELTLGDIISVNVGGSEDYLTEYRPYVVVKAAAALGGGLILKEINSGTGSDNTGYVNLTVSDIFLGNSDTNILETDPNYIYECNIGDKITFKYAFDSELHQDVRGTVNVRLGTDTVGTEKVYPDGKPRTWSYDTKGLTSGTYTFRIWGTDSTNKRSDTTTIYFRIGGLAVASTFNQETVLEESKAFKIPVSVTAADTTNQINAIVDIDGRTALTTTIKVGASTLTIPSSYATTGVHKIQVYLNQTINENLKTSNKLEYDVVVAAANIVYAIPNTNAYISAEGTRTNILLRTILLGGERYSFTGILNITKNNEIVYTNNYTLNFGSNLIQITGLEFDSQDYETAISGGNEIKYTEYTATFNVSCKDDSNAYPANTQVAIRITENDYNLPTVADDSLLCEFKADGMSNQSDTRNTWLDTSGNNVGATFNNFNWVTNGWLSDNDGNTALTLNGGSYVELDIAPLEKEITDGLTISVDFQTEDILDANAKVISCLYEYDGTDTVVYYLRDAYGDYIKSGNINVINYFKYAGGYCWLDGITYTADGVTSYEVTYSPSERTINYNKGEVNPSYNNPADGLLYDSNKATDLCKNKGTEQQQVTKQRGFYIDTQYAVLSNSSSLAKAEDKFHLNFSEKTRTKIDLIISRSADTAPYYFPSMIGYTNGCLSSIERIAGVSQSNTVDTDQFIQESAIKNRKFKVYLGCKASYNAYGNIVTSETGKAQIYSVRLYNKALSPEEILNNYAADIPDLDKKKTIIDNNDLLNKGSIPRTIPEICLIGYKSEDASGAYYDRTSINQFIMQLSNTDAGSVSDLKSMRAPAYIRYTDVSGDNWEYDGVTALPVRLQFQGTSSMVYPMKNYKFKIYNPSVVDTSGITGIQETASGFQYGKKLKFDIGNGVEENTFVLKADFMDSSHSNNTGAANFIADYNEITGDTPASRLNSKIRTTVYGYPVLIYYSDNPTDTTRKFIGVGNLNIDKSCTDSYGLKNKVTDTEGTEYDFGDIQYMDDDLDSDILVREVVTDTTGLTATGDAFPMFYKGQSVNGEIYIKDGINYAVKYNNVFYKLYNAPYEAGRKDYIVMINPKTNLEIALITEKGFIRSINNDKIRNVQRSEFKANSGASGAGGFGNYTPLSIVSDTDFVYPDSDDLEDEEYAEYISEVGRENAISFTDFRNPYFYHMQRMIKWISTADETEFLTNLEKHFNKNYLMDYYLTILLLGAVDSLGKNLMIGTWGPENRLYVADSVALDPASPYYDKFAFEYTDTNGVTSVITPVLTKSNYRYNTTDGTRSGGEYVFAEDANGKPLYYDENCFSRLTNNFKTGYNEIIVTTIPGECIWYPTFYDIDTICGLDNAGQLLYDVDIEVGDQLSDGTAVYNTADSNLWRRVKEYLGKVDSNGNSELSERWAILRNSKFTKENLVDKFFYQRQIAKIPEVYYNKDCIIKYIYEGPNEQKGSGSYLYCAHGSRYEQLKRWYTQRLYYLDTMFGRVGTTAASMRFNYSKYDANFNDTDDYYANYATLAANDPVHYYYDSERGKLLDGPNGLEIAPINFNFKTYQPGYVGIKWKNGYKIHMKRVKRGETAVISGNVGTSGDQEVFIYGGSNIKEIGDMYEYNVKSVQFANLNKLNKLILGATGYSCVISALDIGTNTYLSDLRLVNCPSLTTIDVSGCINLKNIDMAGSNITSVSLASGGALESISYANAITSINLNNFINLSNITVGTLSNLTQFVIKNCPKILGTSTDPNAKAWALLQMTGNASSLTNIELTSYGSVDPKLLTNNELFFFPDKYYSYSTAPKIKGEIYYTGSVIPTNYTKFEESFPDLKITYNNISDASEMFANYNNINQIGSMLVYTGDNEYGEAQYTTVKYWKDETEALRNKWHNQTMYNLYGATNVYESDTQFYAQNGEYYRLLGIYDDEDLDSLRAEIKKHISKFSRFTNVRGMFRNLAILDYIDVDTFNNVNLINADTKEMFAGCKNLRYFEVPGDIVKSELRSKYVYTSNNSDVDMTSIDENDLEAGISEGTIRSVDYYYNPYTGTETENTENYAAKGMRILGDDMFYNCKKVRVYIPKISEGKISISATAFRYDTYDPNLTSQPRSITIERPVIMFEHKPYELLATTTAATTTIGSGATAIERNNPVAYTSNGVTYYYDLTAADEKKINYTNNYVTFAGNTWLREIYFDITNVIQNDNTLDPSMYITYAKNSNDEKILLDVKEKVKDSITSFNIADNAFHRNGLNIISVTSGALRNLKYITSVELPLPKFECLDLAKPIMNVEKSVVSIFTESYYDLEKLDGALPSSLKNFFIVNTEVIPTYAFTGIPSLEKVGFSYDVKVLETEAFANCTGLLNFVWGNKEVEATDVSQPDGNNGYVTKIEDKAFYNCKSLREAHLPNTLINLGKSVFEECVALQRVSYSNALTSIPFGTFMGCIKLEALENFSRDITRIEGNAFYNCKSIVPFEPVYDSNNNIEKYRFMFSNSNQFESFNYFSNLAYIGNGAFFNVGNSKHGFAPYIDTVIENGETTINALKVLTRFIFPSSITYIGDSAFYEEKSGGGSVSNDQQIEIVWDGDYDTDFVNLVIGNNAFYNLKFAWSPTGTTEDILKDTVFFPKLTSLGNSCLHVSSREEAYNICLTKNDKTIGNSWINYTNKIIYEYYDIQEITSYANLNNIMFKAIYLLSSADNGIAYMQYVTEIHGPGIVIPATVTTDNNEEYKLIEILSGAFKIYPTINSITFDENSNLTLIESDVLTETNASNLRNIICIKNNIEYYNKVPENLVIQTGNYLAGYLNELSSEHQTGFITLGRYIIGYVETDQQKQTSYTLNLESDSSIANCDIIYDAAFRGCNCNKVIFKDDIEYIYNEAFSGSSLRYLDSNLDNYMVLPSHLKSIGSRAFYQCKFKKIVIPATVETIGNEAFQEYPSRTSGIGSLEWFEFEPGCKATGNPFSPQTEILTGDDTVADGNITLKTLVIPSSMSWVATSKFNMFQSLTQITNLYLGNLERDETTGSIYVDNYPLYLDAEENVTFTETETRYTDERGNPLFCYKFYHDAALLTGNAKLINAVLETAEEKSVCPCGNTETTPGFEVDIDITSIRVFTNAQAQDPGTDISGLKDLSRADLCRILAGFALFDVNKQPSKIRMKNSQFERLTEMDKRLFENARWIEYDHIV